MLEYYSQHPYYLALIIVLALITVVVCIKAVSVSVRRGRENQKIIDKLKEERRLLNDYSIVTETLINNSEPSELFKGVAVNLQKKVADQTDMASEFEKLNTEQKYIYSLYTFFDDINEGLSCFFERNTHPLTDVVREAIPNVLGNDLIKLYNSEYNAYDEDNESVSLIKSEIEDINKEAALLFDYNAACISAGEYIKNNKEKFIP